MRQKISWLSVVVFSFRKCVGVDLIFVLWKRIEGMIARQVLYLLTETRKENNFVCELDVLCQMTRTIFKLMFACRQNILSEPTVAVGLGQLQSKT